MSLLDEALLIGMTERTFWNMTIGEVARVFKAYERQKEFERKEKAYFDYVQASLIGNFVSGLFSKSYTPPKISEIYPDLFEGEDVEDTKEDLSVARFIQFAQAYNKKYEEQNNN